MINIFKRKQTPVSGAITDIKDERDFTREEVASSSIPIWVERDEFNSYPVRNQSTSLSCFPSGTKVLMEDLSYKEIQKIHIGEKVITHNSNIKTVKDVMKRKWQGTMFEIKPYGLRKIIVSPEHPFLIDGKDWVSAKNLKKKMFLTIPKTSNIVKDKLDYSFENDDDFLWSIGFYLAEGSLDNYSVQFSIHRKEVNYYEKIKKTFNNLGANVSIYDKKDTLSSTIILFGEIWAKRFLSYGNKLCYKKELNSKFLTLSPEKQLNIFNGWMNGDGSYNNKDRYVGVSTSKKLIVQMFDILKRNSIKSAIRKRKDVDGKRNAWEISISRREINKLDNINREVQKQNRYYKEDEKNFYIRIDNINKMSSFYNGNIYNIEVEDDNSYIVEGIAVHNCVAQSVATLLGALIEKENGKYLEVSAKPIYINRSNKLSGGMSFREAMQIGAKDGSSFEFSVPSQNLTEEQMNDGYDITEIDKEIAYAINAYSYLAVPFNFDSIASVLREGLPLIVGFRWDYDEWDKEFPKIRENSGRTYHHCITIINYTLIKGKKYLVIQDSWGKNKGRNGLRFVGEEWLQRMTACWYFDRLDDIFDRDMTVEEEIKQIENTKIDVKFMEDLELGMRNDEVKRLQGLLKQLGYFPDIECTGYYGGITYKAVKDIQIESGVLKEGGAGEGRCGPKTRAMINKLYFK